MLAKLIALIPPHKLSQLPYYLANTEALHAPDIYAGGVVREFLQRDEIQELLVKVIAIQILQQPSTTTLSQEAFFNGQIYSEGFAAALETIFSQPLEDFQETLTNPQEQS